MSHFFTIAIVPGTTAPENIEDTVSRLLAPYDENLQIESHQVYFSNGRVERMAKHYRKSPQDLAGLVQDLDDWTGNEGGVDEQGLYYWSTSNPQSKWDWWVIGGCWNGEVRGTPKNDETGFNFGEQYHQLEENMLPVKWLDHKLSCFAIVTPDGAWHQQGQMGWWAVVTNEKDDSEWEKEVMEIIQRHREDILVGVDCHI